MRFPSVRIVSSCIVTVAIMSKRKYDLIGASSEMVAKNYWMITAIMAA